MSTLPGATTLDALQDPRSEQSATVPIEGAVQDPRLALLIFRYQAAELDEGDVPIPTVDEAWAALREL